MNFKDIKYRIASIYIILFAIITVNCQAQELRKAGRYYVAEITKSFKVSAGGHLRVHEVRGDVEVTAWEKDEVSVHEVKKMDVFTREEAETILEKSRSSYRQNGNDIDVGGERYGRDWIKSEFSISVPRSFNVDIVTRGGDVSVEGINGMADLHTSGGEIRLQDIGGEINTKTSGGDIELENCRSRTTLRTSGGDLTLYGITGPLVAKTSGGDIELQSAENGIEVRTSGGSIRLSEVKGEVEAHTSGGDIDLEGIAGDVRVHTSGGDIQVNRIGGMLDASTSGGDIEGSGIDGSAEVTTSGGSIELEDVRGGVLGKTAGGDISVEVTLKEFSKPHDIDLRTAGGEITVYLPEKMPARIRAEIEVTDRWESYNIYSDFPLKSNEEAGGERSERRRRRARYIRSEGDINGGGDLVELSTTNGDIYIKKTRE